MGSALTRLENADLCPALLEHPLLRGFAAEHGSATPTANARAGGQPAHGSRPGRDRPGLGTGLDGAALDGGRRPVVVVTDSPASFGELGGTCAASAPGGPSWGWRDRNPGTAGELEARGGRVWLRAGR